MQFRNRARSCCFLVLILFCLMASGQLPETRTATVRLKVVDFRGDDLGNGTVEVFKDVYGSQELSV